MWWWIRYCGNGWRDKLSESRPAVIDKQKKPQSHRATEPQRHRASTSGRSSAERRAAPRTRRTIRKNETHLNAGVSFFRILLLVRGADYVGPLRRTGCLGDTARAAPAHPRRQPPPLLRFLRFLGAEPGSIDAPFFYKKKRGVDANSAPLATATRNCYSLLPISYSLPATLFPFISRYR